LKGFIMCDNRNGLDTIKSYDETIRQSILQEGIEVKQMNYGMDMKTKNINNLKPNIPILQGDKTLGKSDTSLEYQETISTETLYKTAKAFLIQIKNIEMEIVKSKV